MTENKIQVAFAAIDKNWEDLIPQPTEIEGTKKYVLYGTDNRYPDYLWGLFNDVSTLKTVIEGIADYNTDLKEGIKITITLKKDANAQVVLNKLFKHTQFQTNYGISFLMLDNGVPKTLGLKEIIEKYINYQKEIIVRRTKFDLDKAEKQVHILEGLKIALDNIDAVIKTIKE